MNIYLKEINPTAYSEVWILSKFDNHKKIFKKMKSSLDYLLKSIWFSRLLKYTACSAFLIKHFFFEDQSLKSQWLNLMMFKSRLDLEYPP